MVKRGRPYIEKVPFSSTCLQEALGYRKVSLRCLDTDPILAASERTIRRAKKEGLINPDILDRLGKRLNVDPLFLSGKYDITAHEYANNEQEAQNIMSQFHVENFPYLLQEKRQLRPLQYIMDLLVENNIPESDFYNLSREDQVLLFLELERATSKILWKYFNPFNSSFSNYSIPMPLEDELKNFKSFPP